MEKVETLNSKKEKLVGILDEGNDEDNKKKLIIFCHGFLSAHKNNCFFPELSKRLNNAGYSTYRFDFSGYGESEGKFEENTISKNIEDIKIVVEHFKKKGYAIFSILGHSMGATEVICYKSKYNDAKSIIAIVPRVYNLKAVKERYTKEQIEQLDKEGFFIYEVGGKSFKISREFIYDRMNNYEDIRIQAKKITCPVLLVHGDSDTTTPKEESKDLKKVLNQKAMLKIIPEEDHNFSNPEHQEVLYNSIITFLAAVNRGIF